MRLYDPDTLQVYALRLRFIRTETEGPTFEKMRLRIEAIASHSGLKGIFRLLGADVYEVLEVEPVEHEVGLPAHQLAPQHASCAPFTMKALQEFSDRIHRAATLDSLLDSVLETLEMSFGFHHSMILLASERPERLELIASRGYPPGGVGSEVGFGEGIIGMVAEARKPVRISGLLRQLLYAYAVAKRAQERGLCPDDRRIPLPGLASPESQLGIPLLAHDDLVGVLCIESNASYRFHEEDRAYLEVLGGYLAIAIQNVLLRERAEEGDEPVPAPRPVAGSRSGPPGPVPHGLRPKIEVAYYKADECVLVDGEYLVRGLPAKVLHKVLREHQAEGRDEFTNRLLRLDKSLQLPVVKDNLESRLILLRRRLEERCPEIRIAPSGRGRFRLELSGEVGLVERP